MKSALDAVFLLAFGGPSSPDDIAPYLQRVMEGRPFQEAQREEIIRHYKAVGGKSPLNELTRMQGKRLEAFFRQKKSSLPVYIGFRFAFPFIPDALEAMSSKGIRNVRAIIMSPHQNTLSWNGYKEALLKAKSAIQNASLRIELAKPFFDHPLFIEAAAGRVAEVLSSPLRQQPYSLVFTAHSLPLEIAEHSSYAEQVTASADLVAKKLKFNRWQVAYQSRSGNSEAPWLSPDICEVLRKLAQEGERSVVIVPIGFVCDHVEILYDLDIEAKNVAEALGIRFVRAKTVGDHSQFIEMLEDCVQKPAAEML
ncbi:MAG: ferrochelatase [Candidatus Omnitrophota bacterium]